MPCERRAEAAPQLQAAAAADTLGAIVMTTSCGPQVAERPLRRLRSRAAGQARGGRVGCRRPSCWHACFSSAAPPSLAVGHRPARVRPPDGPRVPRASASRHRRREPSGSSPIVHRHARRTPLSWAPSFSSGGAQPLRCRGGGARGARRGGGGGGRGAIRAGGGGAGRLPPRRPSSPSPSARPPRCHPRLLPVAPRSPSRPLAPCPLARRAARWRPATATCCRCARRWRRWWPEARRRRRSGASCCRWRLS